MQQLQNMALCACNPGRTGCIAQAPHGQKLEGKTFPELNKTELKRQTAAGQAGGC
ncbi:hypothetical protein CENSYa_0351 [Cenarchaeum symbiosum A]|uniref:Uncharacterized protein n=1 Tax=Cenarchaeum symbiosum (strain A) TaxID=414004 RepID=A0RUH0_CENSY|nr:hypothetical protein CENSYa_0351 [Cenarchaeum symbiosum A]